jgi:hypothetical protein
MPEIRFTEEDHAFAQEFVDRLELSGVAGTVREFLSKEDADWLLAQTERDLRNHALMMKLAEAVVTTAAVAGLAEKDGYGAHEARYHIHYDNFGRQRSDEDYLRQHALGEKLPPNPDEDEGGSVVLALMSGAIADMKLRTGLNESETV